ncbi:MAG: hemolysin family protein [Candidatus Aminicenantia bacterium]
MNSNYLFFIFFLLSFIFSFLISLFEISFNSFSRIALSRFLKTRENKYKFDLLEKYEELELSLKTLSHFFQLLFFLLLFFAFPKVKGRFFLLLLTAFLIYTFFFELIPRLINSLNRERILSLFLPFFKGTYLISTPFLLLMKLIKPEVRRIKYDEALEEQIKIFIGEGEQEGIIEQEDRELIESVVEFGDTLVKEIMTPRVDMVCIRADASIRELRDLILEKKHSRIPVYNERIDNIEGIVLAKDLLKFWEDKYLNSPITPLIRPVYFVPETMNVSELLKDFQRRRQKLAIVVDEYGGVSGLITMEDLVEEIVGEIRDEYDEELEEIIREGPNSYLVKADVKIEDVEELLGLKLEDENYNTVGGLVTHTLGRLPEKGEKVKIKGLTIEMLEVDQRKINQVRIKKEDLPEITDEE